MTLFLPEDEIIDLYLNLNSSNKIGKKYGASGRTIIKLLKKHGVKIRNKHWRKDYFDEETQQTICNKYKNYKSTGELSREYNCGKGTINKILRRNNITIRNNKNCHNKFPEWKEVEICEEYKKGTDTTKLQNKYNCSNETIRYILVRHNIKRREKTITSRKYKINENYFEKIDDQDKAYMLGFIYADGGLNRYSNSLIIKIQRYDRTLLEIFKKLLDYGGIVKDVTDKMVYKGINKEYKMSVLSVTSKKLYSDMIKIGLHPNKSFTITLPKLRKDLIRHFIRGVFDGDGNIHKRKDKYEYLEFSIISGSKVFLEELSKNLPFSINVNKNTSVWRLGSKKKENIGLLYDFMYKDARIFLKRKKDIFNQ